MINAIPTNIATITGNTGGTTKPAIPSDAPAANIETLVAAVVIADTDATVAI